MVGDFCIQNRADNSQLDDTNEPVHDGLSAFGEVPNSVKHDLSLFNPVKPS